MNGAKEGGSSEDERTEVNTFPMLFNCRREGGAKLKLKTHFHSLKRMKRQKSINTVMCYCTSSGSHRKERVKGYKFTSLVAEYQANICSSIFSLHRWVGSAEKEERPTEDKR